MQRRTIVALALGLVACGLATWAVQEAYSRADVERQVRHAGAIGQTLEDRFFLRHRDQLVWLAGRDEIRRRLATGTTDPRLGSFLQDTAGLLGLSECLLLDRTGRVVASSDPTTVGADWLSRRFVRTALGGLVGFGLEAIPNQPELAVAVAGPVYDRGVLVGAIGFRTGGERLVRFFDDQPGTLLLDPTGALAAGPSDGSLNPKAWRWIRPDLVDIAHEPYRLERFALTVVPGYALALVEPLTLRWVPYVVVNLMVAFATALVLLALQLYRSAQARRRDRLDRAQQERLFANLLEGIAVVGADGRVIWANPAFRRLIQWTDDSGYPPLGDLWDRPGPGAWAEVLEGRREWVVFESVIRGRAGAWTPVAAGFTAAGSRFLLSVLDLSERYRSDQVLRHTQKLTALGQLSGGIAHDLNNILGVLTGMTDLIKLTLADEDPLHETVDLMVVTLERAGNLAEKMLGFARQTPVERQRLDVAALLREVEFLGRAALPPGVGLRVEVEEGPHWVIGDVDLLQSALINLLLNAGDAQKDRAGGVVIGGREVGGRFEIAVEDQGIGMDPATLARIFEPFFSTKGKQGTGLGLSLVRRTVQDHQGTIKVESRPGIGTRVLVQLPLAPGTTGSPAPESAPLPPATA